MRKIAKAITLLLSLVFVLAVATQTTRAAITDGLIARLPLTADSNDVVSNNNFASKDTVTYTSLGANLSNGWLNFTLGPVWLKYYQNFTMCFQTNTSDSSGFMYYEADSGEDNGFSIDYGNSGAGMASFNNHFIVTYSSASGLIVPNNLYSWCIVRTNSSAIPTSNWKMYVNNTLIINQNSSLRSGSPTLVQIGRYRNTADRITGYIKEFCVWNRSLDSSEIPTYSTSGCAAVDTTVPVINLIAPFNATSNTSTTWSLSCNATDETALNNITLWHNLGGTFAQNLTNTTTGTLNSSTFTFTSVNTGTYTWGCKACDSSSNCASSSYNWSFNVSAANIAPSWIVPASVVLFKDNFTDTNGVALPNHIPDTGIGWVQFYNVTSTYLNIVINELRTNGIEYNGGVAYYTNDTMTTADYIVSLKWTANGGTAPNYPIGLIARYTDSANYYGLDIDPWDGLRIYSNIAGSKTLLASMSINLNLNSNISFKCVGSNLTALINNTPVFSVIDANLASAGHAGIFSGNLFRTVYTNRHYWDNYIIDSVVDPSVPIPGNSTPRNVAPPNHWYNLSAYATDGNGDILTFKVQSQNNVTLINCSIADTWYMNCAQPGNNLVGTNAITINATDGINSTTTTITVSVTFTNTYPVWSAIPGNSTLEDTTPMNHWYNLSLYASDVDTDQTLAYSVLNQTNSSLINCFTADTWYMNCSQPAGNLTGSNIVTVNATDATNSVTTTINISVLAVNDLPDVDLLIPTQDDHTNLNGSAGRPLDFLYNVTDIDTVSVDCEVWINDTSLFLGRGVQTLTTGTVPAAGNISMNVSIVDGNYTWFVTCNDGTGKRNSTQRQFFIDTVAPNWVLGSNPAADNSSWADWYFRMDPIVSDNNLYQALVNITNSSGYSMYQNFTNDIGVTTLTFVDVVNVSTWPVGTYTNELSASDDHTAKAIPDYSIGVIYDDGIKSAYGQKPSQNKPITNFSIDASKYKTTFSNMQYTFYRDADYDILHYPNGSVAIGSSTILVEYLQSNNYKRLVNAPESIGYYQNGSAYVMWRYYDDGSGTNYTLSCKAVPDNPIKCSVSLRGNTDRMYRVTWQLDNIAKTNSVNKKNKVTYDDIAFDYDDVAQIFGNITTINHSTSSKGNGKKTEFYFDIGNRKSFTFDPSIDIVVPQNVQKIIYQTGTNISLDSAQSLSNLTTYKATDRYVFSFYSETPRSVWSFQVVSNEKIYDRTSRYTYPSYVTGKNWLDFNTNGSTVSYSSLKINDTVYNVTITTVAAVTNLTFYSLGGLNVASEYHTFLVDRLSVATVNISSNDQLNNTNSNITCAWGYSDFDANAQANNETKWFKNGAEQAGLKNVTLLYSNYTTRYENWLCSVRTHDGYSWGNWSNSSVMNILNAPPYKPTFAVPSSPANQSRTTGNWVDLRANTCTDPEGDTMIYAFLADTNNPPTTLGANTTDVDYLFAPVDGSIYYWKVVCSDWNASTTSDIWTFTENTAPIVTVINISSNDGLNNTNSNITCAWSFNDSNGDSYTGNTTAWYRNGIQLTGVNNFTVLLSNYTERWNNITCSVSVYDGYENSAFYNTTMRIINTPSVISYLNISSDDGMNNSGSNLITAYGYTDLESDSISQTQSKWYKDTLEQSDLRNYTTVSTTRTTKNETWLYSASLFDGFDWSLWANSSGLYIRNTPPNITVLNITFGVPSTQAGNITVHFNFVDVDNDTWSGNNETKWFNGSIERNTSKEISELRNYSTVPDGYGKHDQIWYASVRVYDSTDWSLWYNTSDYYYGPIPLLESVNISSNDQNKTSGNIKVGYSYNNTDPVVVTVNWFRNEVSNGTHANATLILAPNLAEGETWKASVMVADAYMNSIWRNTSSLLVIQDNPQVWFSTANNSLGVTFTYYTFQYYTNDSSAMKNCTLYYNSTMSNSTTSVVRGLNYARLYMGKQSNYSMQLNCTDKFGNANGTRILFRTEVASPSGGGGGGPNDPAMDSTQPSLSNSRGGTAEYFIVGQSTLFKELVKEDKILVPVAGETHTLSIRDINPVAQSVMFEIQSDPINVTLWKGQEVYFDVDNSGSDDFSITVLSLTNTTTNVMVKQVVPIQSSTVIVFMETYKKQLLIGAIVVLCYLYLFRKKRSRMSNYG